MVYAALFLIILALAFGPALWVRFVMRRHSTEIPGMPGTGGELATHLLAEAGLRHVRVERTRPMGDHYDPSERVVRLGPDNHDGKSLTAVAVAAHEVGHAIQHARGDRNLALRTRLGPVVASVTRGSATVLWIAPVIGVLTRHPAPFSLILFVGLSGMIASVLMHLVTLPTEWDASFGKALPLLTEGQYIAPGEDRAVRQVLRAAALTYAAGALADVLNLARWIAIVLRR